MLAAVPHRIHYTLKANSSRGLLEVLRELGAGVDVVSGGELRRALAAGFAPEDIIFGGVGKTRHELAEALDANVLLINAESEAEVRLIDGLAAERRIRARVSLRVNPEVTLDSPHEYIKTGGRGHKFGIPYDDVVHVAEIASELPNVDLVGLDMHLGSQLSRIDPYREGTERLASIFAELVRRGITSLQYLDIGGGLGVRYDTELPPDLQRFSELVLPTVAATGLRLIMEPGRFVIGNAGALVTEVLYRKHSGGKDYVVVDAGMTELLRPSHYGAYHRIEAVGPSRVEQTPRSTWSVRCARAAISLRSIVSWTTFSLATSSSCATWAPMGMRWRRTTTAGFGPRRCWWTVVATR